MDVCGRAAHAHTQISPVASLPPAVLTGELLLQAWGWGEGGATGALILHPSTKTSLRCPPGSGHEPAGQSCAAPRREEEASRGALIK